MQPREPPVRPQLRIAQLSSRPEDARPSEGWSLWNSSEHDLKISTSHPGNSRICSSAAGLRDHPLWTRRTAIVRAGAGQVESAPPGSTLSGKNDGQNKLCASVPPAWRETRSVILGCPEPRWPEPSTLRESDGASFLGVDPQL